jgi:hypothetical protein
MPMNIQHYKQRLIDLEKALSARIRQEAGEGRGEFIDAAHDVADASVADLAVSEEFAEVEQNADVLQRCARRWTVWPTAPSVRASSMVDLSKSPGSRPCPGRPIVRSTHRAVRAQRRRGGRPCKQRRR